MKIESCGEFTADLWQSVQHIFEKIINHPFNLDLAEGSLSDSIFCNYLAQDILYIKDDTLAIKKTASKADKVVEHNFLNQLVEEGISLEEALHQKLKDEFSFKLSDLKNPVCQAYTDFLLANAEHESYAVSLAALLPCYWVYQNVGIETASKSSSGNPYQDWLDVYSGKEFTEYTKTFIQLLEDIASKSSSETRTKMKEVFITSTEFELEFVNSVY